MIRALAFALIPLPALAAQCADHGAMTEQLAEKYGDAVQGRGITANGVMIEVYAGPKGTWTVVATRGDGQSCLVADGDGWQSTIQPGGVPG